LKKDTEYGAVEIWMNERVRKACASSCADFLYGFLEVLILFIIGKSMAFRLSCDAFRVYLLLKLRLHTMLNVLLSHFPEIFF